MLRHFQKISSQDFNMLGTQCSHVSALFDSKTSTLIFTKKSLYSLHFHQITIYNVFTVFFLHISTKSFLSQDHLMFYLLRRLWLPKLKWRLVCALHLLDFSKLFFEHYIIFCELYHDHGPWAPKKRAQVPYHDFAKY